MGSPLDPNLKDVVYNTFVAAGNGYYDMKARYEAARLDGTDPDEVVYCLRAMASTSALTKRGVGGGGWVYSCFVHQKIILGID